MSGPSQRPERVSDLVVRGELSITAWFAVIDEPAERWVTRRMLPALEKYSTLYYPEVALLLVGAISVLLGAGIGVALL